MHDRELIWRSPDERGSGVGIASSSLMGMVDRIADQRIVFAVVSGALLIGSLPFLNKAVRDTEANVAAMRDASYDAKDAARDSRLRVRRE